MTTATKTTKPTTTVADFKTRIAERAEELKADDLKIIRSGISKALDNESLDDDDTTELVEALERRRIPVEALADFAEVLRQYRDRKASIDAQPAEMAELERTEQANLARKKAIETELIGIRNKLAWVSTMRQIKFADKGQFQSLVQLNPLLFSDNLDEALKYRPAVDAHGASRHNAEPPAPLLSFGRAV